VPPGTKKETKVNMLRRKMMKCRRKNEKRETTWKHKMVAARDSNRKDIHEKLIPVIDK
jgi:hypothetical protein